MTITQADEMSARSEPITWYRKEFSLEELIFKIHSFYLSNLSLLPDIAWLVLIRVI